LTANAIEGDKKRFMDAGMDDYLTKPLVLSELERVLTGFDFNEIFNTTKESITLGDEVIFRLYTSTVEVANETVEEIQQAMEKSDYTTIANAAHKLKGASGSLRLNYIHDLSKKLEEDSRAEIQRDYTVDLDKIKQFFKFFEDSLEKAKN